MRKKTSIKLLRYQIEKINDKNVNRNEWILLTNSVILRVFPASYLSKIRQISNIQETPDFFNDLPPHKIMELRKLKAERYLQNYIEEIELLGTESRSHKMENVLEYFRFW